MSEPLAERLFAVPNETDEPSEDKQEAQRELEALLNLLGVPFERIGWDYYDASLELYGVSPSYRLFPEAQAAIANAGFSKCYVNHDDEWETHYTLFKGVSEGWRVSYPHKRKEDNGEIWVEETPIGWPKEWIETGYVVIKPNLSPSAEGETK